MAGTPALLDAFMDAIVPQSRRERRARRSAASRGAGAALSARRRRTTVRGPAGLRPQHAVADGDAERLATPPLSSTTSATGPPAEIVASEPGCASRLTLTTQPSLSTNSMSSGSSVFFIHIDTYGRRVVDEDHRLVRRASRART